MEPKLKVEPKLRKQSREKENNSVLVNLFNSWIKPHLKPDLLHGWIMLNEWPAPGTDKGSEAGLGRVGCQDSVGLWEGDETLAMGQQPGPQVLTPVSAY